VPLAEMLPVYYRVRDWDAAGIPTRRLLDKLDLADAAGVADEVRAEPERFRARRRTLREREGDVLREVLAESRRWFEQATVRRDEWREEARRVRAAAWALRVRRASFAIEPDRCRRCGLCAARCPVGAIAWRRTERAVIDPAKCIRCGACAEVCPPHFDAVRFIDVEPAQDRTRVVYRVLDGKCEKCGICFKKCPVPGAISWRKGQLAVIHDDRCTACGRCRDVCPPKFGAIEQVTRPAGDA
jgi:ferredoxin